jgi:hypothetical protein
LVYLLAVTKHTIVLDKEAIFSNVEALLSRGIDYLGDIGAKLRDLRGYRSLAHELIQNADDATNATRMYLRSAYRQPRRGSPHARSLLSTTFSGAALI